MRVPDPRRSAPPAGPARRPPVSRSVLAAVLVAVLAATWFAVNVARPRHPLILLWLAAPTSLLLVTHSAWRTASTPTLPPPTRRFWRHFAVAVVLIAMGTASYSYDSLGGPTVSQHISPVTLALYGAGTLVIIWSMWRLPIGLGGPGARLQLGLDAGIVGSGTAVFMWHYQTRVLLMQGADLRSSLIVSGLAMVFALVAVFALAKVIMSGAGVIDRSALRLLALAVVGDVLGEIPQTYIRGKPYLLCPQVTIPVIAICAVLAAERQRRVPAGSGAVAGETSPARRRHAYSRLPYLAVAAVDGLLVGLACLGQDADLPVVAVGAVGLTALVIVRQLVSFRENERLLARLDHNASHDALTQLPNRVLFHRRLQAALAGPDPARRVCVALIDLNDFKMVNDTLGHGVGDALLVELAPRLVGSVRPCDTVARLGGDEFVVVFDGINPAAADGIARRIIDALAVPVRVEGHELVIRASIGLADGATGDDAHELLRRADVAMYAAKNAGKPTGRSTYQRFGTHPATPPEALPRMAGVRGRWAGV